MKPADDKIRLAKKIDLALPRAPARRCQAEREVRQAGHTADTNERPIDGGGDDHANGTQAEANAAARAKQAIDQNPTTPIPADVTQSPEIERQRQAQQELLAEKDAIAEMQKETQRHSHKPRHG